MAAAKKKAGKTTAAAATDKISPLDVMLGAMRELWARAESLRGKPECEEERLGLIRQASGEAHKAAVYVHPRIASVEVEGEGVTPGAADNARVMGSRELARRLLFAVAIAEHFPEEKS